MPVTDSPGSSSYFSFIGRSVQRKRRDETHSADDQHSISSERDLEDFQKIIGDVFRSLSIDAAEVLSLTWTTRLLGYFVLCLEEFRGVLFKSKYPFSRPPLDQMLSEFFDRGVRALDICNAARDGIEQIRQWRSYIEIIVLALDRSSHTLGDGQLQRARKALLGLSALVFDVKEAGSSSGGLTQQIYSFGRFLQIKDSHHSPGSSQFRSPSWSLSKTWSAAKQLQAISKNLNAPRSHEISATNGLVGPVYTLNIVQLFVAWALVAAIPCQGRGLQTRFSISHLYCWASSIHYLRELIIEESKKKDRKNSCGLLKEINQIEKSIRHLTELLDTARFPLAEEMVTELKQEVQVLVQILKTLKIGLDPLEHQIRDVFHKIICARTEELHTYESHIM